MGKLSCKTCDNQYDDFCTEPFCYASKTYFAYKQSKVIEELQEIRLEIDSADIESVKNEDYHKGLQFALSVIDKHIAEEQG